MTDNAKQQEGQSEPKKRGRKRKEFYAENAPDYFRNFFQFLNMIEKHHNKMNVEKAKILEIAAEQGIDQNLAELLLNAIELHISNIKQRKTLEEIKERIK